MAVQDRTRLIDLLQYFYMNYGMELEMNVLVINCGSSSLKYQLINMDNEKVIAKGTYERIGEKSFLTHKIRRKVIFNT